MYYGITFVRSDGATINTTDDWHIVPTSRPLVSPPSVKDNFIEIPGADGALDYTEALSGTVHFGMREGSWEFMVLNDHRPIVERNGTIDNYWWDLYHKMLEFLHGQRMKEIRLESDPNWVYTGRLYLSDWKSEQDFSKVTINYKIDPKTKPANTVTDDDNNVISTHDDWLWNDLFANTIFYGGFDVDGRMARTIINPSSGDVDIIFNCKTAMTAEYDGNTLNFTVGQNKVTMPSGDNEIILTGAGHVDVYYNTGASI